MHPEPIAVIGRSAIFPLARNVGEFAANIFSGRDCTRPLNQARYGLDPRLLAGKPGEVDKTASLQAGFIDFDIDLSPYRDSIDGIEKLDPYYHWTLHLIHEALKDAGKLTRREDRAGLIQGNLTFAIESAQEAFEEALALKLLREKGLDAPYESRMENWHQSALPSLLAAKVFGLEAQSFALDAACASGLYALELACRALRENQADMMIAMGVNRCEMAALTVGFSQLGALSATGNCRPFAQNANGLVVGEGGGAFVLKRLSDAIRDKDSILCLIRSGGLSCDGKAGGLLAPDSDGQLSAMQNAWKSSGISLDRVELIECHGTGTTLGDATEVKSMRRLLDGHTQKVVVGSIKSQIGHCLSAAGMAAALKAMESVIHKTLPPTLHDEPAQALEGSTLRLLKESRSWEEPRGGRPRVSAASGFGFGGTNAHVIFEEWKGQKVEFSTTRSRAEKLAITAVEITSGNLGDVHEVLHALKSSKKPETSQTEGRWPKSSGLSYSGRSLPDLKFVLGRFRISPREAERLLPQQLLLLSMTHRLLNQMEKISLPPKRSGVIVGMGFMANITDHTLRLKAPRLLKRLGHENPGEELVQTLRNAICPPVNSDDVIGDIPNFPANRISSELDLRAPSYVVFQEEGAGLRALKLASEAILRGDADHMIVGSVDLPLDYKEKLAEEFSGIQSRELQAEGGAVLLLEAASTALKKPLAYLNRLECSTDSSLLEKARSWATPNAPLLWDTSLNHLLSDELKTSSSELLGSHRCSQGLVSVATLTLALSQQFLPADPGRNSQRLRPRPWILDGKNQIREGLSLSFGGLNQMWAAHLMEAEEAPIVSVRSKSRIAAFRASSVSELIQALDEAPKTDFTSRKPNDLTLAIVARSDEEFASHLSRAKAWLSEKPEQELRDPRGIFYQPDPILNHGKAALLYPGFGNLYADLGRELMLKMPNLQKAMQKRTSHAKTLALGHRLWDEEKVDLYDLGVFEISFATTFFQCLTTQLMTQDLYFNPDAVIGFSGGEINCLSALGVWNIDSYFAKATQDKVFSDFLSGEFKTLRKHVEIQGDVDWMTTLVSTSPEDFAEIAEGVDGVYLCMLNAPGEIMVSGIRERLEPLLKKGGWHITPLPIPQAYHCSLALHHQKELHTLWSNPSTVPEDLIFYAHATGKGYIPDQETLATNIVRTCCEYVDFIPVIENAYNDGVRLFLELGPQTSVCRMVQSILGNRPYRTMSINSRERGEELQLLFGLAELLASGGELNLKALKPWLVQPEEAGRKLSFPTGRTLGQQDMKALADLLVHPSMKSVPQKPVPPKAEPAQKIQQPSIPVQVKTPAPQKIVPPVQNMVSIAPKAIAEPAQNRSIMADSTFVTSQLEYMEKMARQQELFLKEQVQLMQVEQNMQGISVPASPVSVSPVHLTVHATHSDEGLMPTPNPMFDKEHCRAFADGKLADVFGPDFSVVDSFKFRTRYPTPPYLLVDRVVSMDATPKSMKPGRCVTEFDVRKGDWFLVDNHVPICVSIESGQADLFLISYLGIDEEVAGERVYRLLGADFTIFDGMPEAPCTLRYEIEIKSFVNHNGTWLFFFEGVGYANNRRFIQWKNGCAGYFTPEELAAKDDAIIEDWTPGTPEFPYNPVRECRKNSFHREELQALARGDVYGCFGPGFEVPFPATYGPDFFPKVTTEDLLMMDEVRIDRASGRHGYGYLESTLHLDDNHWYFTSHFVTDNVMPGTLMLDGCSQLLRLYMIYLGFGFQARGGVFHAVPNEEIKVKCRGQVIPGMKRIDTIMHVRKIEPGSRPRVYADAIMYCDGKEVVHIENLAWEIRYSELPALPEVGEQAYDRFGRAVHTNETQLIELTVGNPSRYFGEHYKIFDQSRQISRMPNPPYACITRVLEIEGQKRLVKPGARILNEYDLDPQEWHFRAHHNTLPFCVLNEVVLQPCGLLPQLLELDMMSPSDRFIRNLGGRMITHADLFAVEDRIIADVVLKEVVNTPDTFMVKYDGTYTLPDGTLIAEGKDLHFGFFSKDGLAAAPGLTLKADEKAKIEEFNAKSTVITEENLPAPHEIGTRLKLPQWPALFFDRAVELRPEGGRFGKGYLKVVKAVDPSEWIFYSHFYMDSVVPGSYSLDACTQALRYYMLYLGLDQNLGEDAYFRINHDQWMDWQYRGQILQHNKEIEYILEIREIAEDQNGPYAVAMARVVCDGKHIYSLDNMRVSMKQ